jgi:hypothetical protein
MRGRVICLTALVGGIVLWAADVPAQERTYTWTLTQSEMNYIGALLDEQKVKDAGRLIQKIQQQISQQDQAAQATAMENLRRQIESEKKKEP